MRVALGAVGLFLGVALAGAASAQQPSAADVIKSRQDQMKALGADFRIVSDALKADSPDTAAIAAASQRIADVIKGTNAYYPPGTGPESGLKTRAMAEVWSQNADFNRAGDFSIAEAARFRQAAGSGDATTIRAGFKALTDSCVACHAKFRAEERK